MSIYLIRNTETKRWLDCNIYECDDADKCSRWFRSEKAARKCLKQTVSGNERRNAWYAEDPRRQWEGWKPYFTTYEVVAFKLVLVGSLG